MLHKVKVLIEKTLYVSKLTTVSNKKLRILFSVIFANIAVALDVVIILIFSVLLTNDINYSNEFIVSSINFILENNNTYGDVTIPANKRSMIVGEVSITGTLTVGADAVLVII